MTEGFYYTWKGQIYSLCPSLCCFVGVDGAFLDSSFHLVLLRPLHYKVCELGQVEGK